MVILKMCKLIFQLSKYATDFWDIVQLMILQKLQEFYYNLFMPFNFNWFISDILNNTQ